MLDIWHKLAFAAQYECSLTVTITRGVAPWPLEKLADKTQGGCLVPSALQQGVEDIAICIDGAPRPVLPSRDRHHHFIKLPFISEMTAKPSKKLTSKLEAEIPRPFQDGLERDFNAALGQQIFDVKRTKRKPVREPHSVGDDLGRKAVWLTSGRRSFGDVATLSWRSA